MKKKKKGFSGTISRHHRGTAVKSLRFPSVKHFVPAIWF